MKPGLDQIDGLLVPVVHLGDTPPAYDARTLGHATRVAVRGLPGGQGRLKIRGLHIDYDSDEEQQPEPFDLEAVNRRLAALGTGQP
jgi:hypothetical protein